jgi:hypothetical protein
MLPKMGWTRTSVRHAAFVYFVLTTGPCPEMHTKAHDYQTCPALFTEPTIAATASCTCRLSVVQAAVANTDSNIAASCKLYPFTPQKSTTCSVPLPLSSLHASAQLQQANILPTCTSRMQHLSYSPGSKGPSDPALQSTPAVEAEAAVLELQGSHDALKENCPKPKQKAHWERSPSIQDNPLFSADSLASDAQASTDVQQPPGLQQPASGKRTSPELPLHLDGTCQEADLLFATFMMPSNVAENGQATSWHAAEGTCSRADHALTGCCRGRAVFAVPLPPNTEAATSKPGVAFACLAPATDSAWLIDSGFYPGACSKGQDYNGDEAVISDLPPSPKSAATTTPTFCFAAEPPGPQSCCTLKCGIWRKPSEDESPLAHHSDTFIRQKSSPAASDQPDAQTSSTKLPQPLLGQVLPSSLLGIAPLQLCALRAAMYDDAPKAAAGSVSSGSCKPIVHGGSGSSWVPGAMAAAAAASCSGDLNSGYQLDRLQRVPSQASGSEAQTQARGRLSITGVLDIGAWGAPTARLSYRAPGSTESDCGGRCWDGSLGTRGVPRADEVLSGRRGGQIVGPPTATSLSIGNSRRLLGNSMAQRSRPHCLARATGFWMCQRHWGVQKHGSKRLGTAPPQKGAYPLQQHLCTPHAVHRCPGSNTLQRGPSPLAVRWRGPRAL